MLNSYKEFKDYLNNLEDKPTLLLHVCCAPCSSHTLKLLVPYFKITVYFSNDNIYPHGEFINRFNELKRFIVEANLDVDVVIDDYDYDRFLNAINGKENLGERSIRCYECYKMRLTRSVIYAKNNNLDYFTTSLSISPHKVTKWINEIGYNLEEEYGIKYLYSDFKKESGYQNSIQLSKEFSLYRQDYCGCLFSKKEKDDLK